MSLYRSSGFRRCGACERVFSPPFAPGWATADDDSWMCPACCGRLDEEEGERVLALVEAARAHQPFINWRRAAIERLCIDMVADLRQMGWRVEREEPAAATLIKASSGRASREPSSSVRAHAERRAPR